MNRTLLLALLLVAPLAMPAAAQEHEEHGHEAGHDESHHVSEIAGVRILHAWTRATDGAEALVFMEIDNRSDGEIVVEGGESDAAETVELVGFRLVNGAPVYEPLPSMPVGAGKEMQLAPNGLAFRLGGLREPLHQGDEFEMEVELDGGHVDVFVAVEAADARQHSHAGHQH